MLASTSKRAIVRLRSLLQYRADITQSHWDQTVKIQQMEITFAVIEEEYSIIADAAWKSEITI